MRQLDQQAATAEGPVAGGARGVAGRLTPACFGIPFSNRAGRHAVVRGQAQDQWKEREKEEEAKEDDAKDEACEEQMVGSPAWWLWVSVQLMDVTYVSAVRFRVCAARAQRFFCYPASCCSWC